MRLHFAAVDIYRLHAATGRSAVGHRVEPAAKQPHPASLRCPPNARDPDRGPQRRDVIVNKLSRPKASTASHIIFVIVIFYIFMYFSFIYLFIFIFARIFYECLCRLFDWASVVASGL